MIDPAARTHSQTLTAPVASRPSQSEPTASQSFRATFSRQLESTAADSEGTVTLPSMLPGGRTTVTRQNPDLSSSGSSSTAAGGATSGTSAGSTSSTAGSETSGLQGLVINFPNTTFAAASTTATSSSTGGSSESSFDESYWASQPEAVQQLQNIQDPTERQEVATQLAQEGYSIDVPIMVWGWDPQITTEARESLGYTWVPSAEQQPVETAPGITFNGTSYNASSPPAGSITV